MEEATRISSGSPNSMFRWGILDKKRVQTVQAPNVHCRGKRQQPSSLGIDLDEGLLMVENTSDCNIYVFWTLESSPIPQHCQTEYLISWHLLSKVLIAPKKGW